MKFIETKIEGVWIIELEKIGDDRGFFARSFCEKEFGERGLPIRYVQHSISFNYKKGTLRGLHFQNAPHEEAKLVSCQSGSIFDVVVDIRPKSPSWMQWLSVELSDSNSRMLYIPEGIAHGFQTLVDNSSVLYLISEFHRPDSASGIRFDDSKFNIPWPEIPPPIISEKDMALPFYQK